VARRGKYKKHRSKRRNKLLSNRIKSAVSSVISIFKGGKNSTSHKGRAENSSSHKPDLIILTVVALLLIFGWVMVYSSSFYVASQKEDTLIYPYNPFHFFILQGIWISLSAIVGFIIYKIGYKTHRKLSLLAYLFFLVLLVVVLAMPELNGAKQWINIGPASIQPSELMKPFIIVLLASVLSKKWKKPKNDVIQSYIKNKLLRFGLIAGPVVLLVIIGKDLATGGIILLICTAMFIFSNDTFIHNIFSSIMLLGSAAMGAIFTLIEPYRVNRIKTYLHFLQTGQIDDPLNTGYQLRQILIAVGTGGFFGYGYGQSRQKYFYLQETAFSDTIFAVIAEEFGAIGSLITIFAFLILIFRSLKLAANVKSKFASLTVLGITVWFAIQTIVHMGVNVGLIPLTGVTLPFVSYGGSSLLSCTIGISILLNISKEVKLD
jgi:cell division protein FtsW